MQGQRSSYSSTNHQVSVPWEQTQKQTGLLIYCRTSKCDSNNVSFWHFYLWMSLSATIPQTTTTTSTRTCYILGELLGIDNEKELLSCHLCLSLHIRWLTLIGALLLLFIFNNIKCLEDCVMPASNFPAKWGTYRYPHTGSSIYNDCFTAWGLRADWMWVVKMCPRGGIVIVVFHVFHHLRE